MRKIFFLFTLSIIVPSFADPGIINYPDPGFVEIIAIGTFKDGNYKIVFNVIPSVQGCETNAMVLPKGSDGENKELYAVLLASYVNNEKVRIYYDPDVSFIVNTVNGNKTYLKILAGYALK